MSPESHLSPTSPEYAPPTPQYIEQGVDSYTAPQQQVERPVFSSGEHFEQRSEQPLVPQSAPADPADDAATVALPVPADNTAPPSVDTPETANPATAKDGDLIEREWVQKAKQILTETRDDPHARSDRVQALQADYLLKRYNRKLGDVA